MGGSSPLEVGFEYRPITGEDVHARTAPWIPTPMQSIKQAGRFVYTLENLPAGMYEFHAVAKHPLVTIYGADMKMQR